MAEATPAAALGYFLHPRFGNLVSTRICSCRDVQSVPRIDCGNCQGEISELFFAELLPNFVVQVIRDMGLSDLRHGVGPRQSGAFAVGVDEVSSQASNS